MRSRSQLRLISFTFSLLLHHAAPHASGHGAYHDALDALNVEIAQQPAEPALLVKRARLHLSHDEWQAALQDLERVDRLQPAPALTEGLRGAALNLGGQWKAALFSLNAHLVTHPHDAEARFQRARSQAHLGDRKAAAADYREALRSHPEPTAARKAEAAEVIFKHEGADAALTFLSADPTTATDPETLHCALTLALQAGLTDRALSYVASLQLQAPRPEPWMARAARILAEAGRKEEARAAWLELVAHLQALPNLERGTPLLTPLLHEAQSALGIRSAQPVIAAPSSTTAP